MKTFESLAVHVAYINGEGESKVIRVVLDCNIYYEDGIAECTGPIMWDKPLYSVEENEAIIMSVNDDYDNIRQRMCRLYESRKKYGSHD